MCEHEWTRIKRPYQYQIDKAEGVSFMDSKVWIRCKKCLAVKSNTVRKLMNCMGTDFIQVLGVV